MMRVIAVGTTDQATILVRRLCRRIQLRIGRRSIGVATPGVGIDLIETAHNDYSRTRSIVQGNYAASSAQVLTRLLLKEGKDVCKPRRAPRGRKAAGHL